MLHLNRLLGVGWLGLIMSHREKGAAAHVSGPVAEGLCHGDVAYPRRVAGLPVIEGLGPLRSPIGGSG